MLDSDSLLRLLATGRFCSGSRLAAEHSVSRTTVAKSIRRLEKRYQIEVQKVPGRGYRLRHPLVLLDEDEIRRCLPNKGDGLLSRLEIHRILDSTNGYLMNRSGRLNEAFDVVVAEQQTAGRGRNGRRWLSGFGSGIAMSIGMRVDCRMMALSGLSLFVGLVVADALHGSGLVGCQLKWPNDLYWNDRKLGGILIELSGESEGPTSLVIGIGLNCYRGAYCASIDQPATTLEEAGVDLDRNQLIASILRVLGERFPRFLEAGFVAFKDEWNALSLLTDRKVEVMQGGSRFIGWFKGIDDGGAGLVQTQDGIRVLNGGEISLRKRVVY